jgi:hypothetical protein
VDPTEAQKGISDLGQAPVQDLFTTDDLGGWDRLINDTVFGPSGAFTTAQQAAQG